MDGSGRTLFLCSCEDTMELDEGAVRRGCRGGDLRTARQLCRAQVEMFKTALTPAAAVTVACTQEAPLFAEVAEEAGFAGSLTFANVRETGGWAKDGAGAGPKMAALIAAAAVEAPPTPFVTLSSAGVALIYGRDETAIEAGRRLAEHLDVTVLLTRPGEVMPPRANDFPVLSGTIRTATGHLGAFELSVDDFAHPLPSSRRHLAFGPARDGAVSRCDVVIDLSGKAPLFPAADLRPGYVRADPGDPAAVERALFEARDLVGEFDRPRYVTYESSLCAQSRSKRTGCTRCLELCPTGAITPAGDHVAIDANVCAGCGACASVCPTGAASYALPAPDVVLKRLRALLLTYAEAGGRSPVVLFHDGEHGEEMIDALARFGDGLPANVLPLRLNEVTQIGLETLASAFAFGATSVRFLTRARPKHDISGLARNIDYANTILAALGFGEGRCASIETDDPDALGAALAGLGADAPAREAARFQPMGEGRQLLKVAIRELAAVAPTPVERVEMPARAPFGGLDINAEGCTLCLSCVSACPTGALSDNPERPMLRFAEDLCVQCGLCANTCPEKVISLAPRIDFAAWEAPPRVVKEEEPFHCISCGKPFGVKSTIEKIAAKLENRHWMFSGENAKRISVIRMCEDCRVEVVVNESFDPHAAPQRPAPRTTEDYLREREKGDDPLH